MAREQDIQLARRFAALKPAARRAFLEKLREAGIDFAALPIVPVDEAATLSIAQRGLWLTWQLDPTSSAYNMPGLLHLGGPLSEPALRRSLDDLARRHDALRTVLPLDADGEPCPRVQDEASVELRVHDLTALPPDERDARARQEAADTARLPFQLDIAVPWRTTLWRLGANEHRLLIVLHHIAADAWSLDVLLAELAALYAGHVSGDPAALPPLPLTQADYAGWQRRWMEAGEHDRQLAWWREALGDEQPLLDLPLDQPRSAVRGAGEHRLVQRLDGSLSASLRDVARARGASVYMLMLSVLALALRRVSGQGDLRIGTPVANRARAETHGLVGYLANVQVLRVQVDARAPFDALLAQVRDSVLGGQANADLPFDALVAALAPERQPGVHPLFQVKCTEQAVTPPARTVGGLEMRLEELVSGDVHFDLSFDFVDAGPAEGIEARWAAAADIFDATTLDRIAALWTALARQVVQQALQAPRVSVGDWPLPTPASVAATPLLERAEPHVLALWSRGVAERPEVVALQDEERSWRYAALDAQARCLASRLVDAGVGPEARVGVHAVRGAEFVLGLLAVMMAGGVAVPLDPQLPADRLAYQLADSGALCVLAAQSPAWAPTVPVLPLEFADPGLLQGSPTPLRDPHPAQAAYLIYTSGSTGRPKGVVVSHGALANYVQALLDRLALPEEATSFAMVSTVAADLGHTSLFGALCSARTLHLIGAERAFDPDAFAAYMHAHQVDVLKIVPSHLQALLQAAVPAHVLPRHTLVVGGESTSWRLLERIAALRPTCRVVNHYGPTETTVGVLTQPADIAAREAQQLPLGRPLSGIEARVLDLELQDVPVGAIGELYLGGEGLARGYQGRPDTTAERFVAHPTRAGARLYRSGDRVRQRVDGSFEFLGRVDDQVKIRGYRVELAEVTAALRALPAVADATVVVRETGDGESRALVGYVVPAVTGLELSALKLALAAALPDYMVPAAFVELPALPLTANGKIDRRALPEPQASSDAVSEAPVGETEQALAGLWRDLLGVESIGRDDQFFERGGDSILVLKLVARARKIGLKIAPKQVFEHPALRVLAQAITPAPHAAQTPIDAIPVLSAEARRGALPLSWAQQRQWFLWKLDPQGSAYHITGALRLEGPLDADAVRRSLRALVERHEALRTVFRSNDEGVAAQWLLPTLELEVPLFDLGDEPAERSDELARQLAVELNDRPFDLATAPLLRVALLRLGADDHRLLLAMHHIVGDGWSLQLIVDEFLACYQAEIEGRDAALAPLAIQYVDVASWDRSNQAEQDAHVTWWREQLGDEQPVLQLATDHPRRADGHYRAATYRMTLSAATTRGLHAAAQSHGATVFMALLAGWQALLHRATGLGDIRVGVPIAGRDRPETAPVVGLFVNTQVIRARVDGRMTLDALLRQVRERTLAAQAHAGLPFEKLVEALQPERSLGHSPLFQVLHNHQRDTPSSGSTIPGLAITTEASGDQAAQFELALHTNEDARGDLHVALTYASELFDGPTIERLAGHYVAFLQALAEQPHVAIGDVLLMADAERSTLTTWSVGAPLDQESMPVHRLIEAQASRTPQAVALVFGDVSLTYDELNGRANRLAHRLIRLGIGPDVLVGVACERSVEMVIALLATLKAGGAYVPLDPEYPAERLSYMFEDSGVSLLLSHGPVIGRLPVSTAPLLDLASLDLDPESELNPDVLLHDEHLAYAIYTSGSTGRPKGAANRHRALHNRLAWMQHAYPLDSTDAVLQKTPFGFDVSVWEFFWPLMFGAKLVMAGPGDHRDPSRLGELIARHRITTLHFVPSMLQAFMAHGGVERCGSLKRIVCSGEALPAELQNQVLARLPHADLYNLYGPTEAAIDVTHWTCVADGRASVAIGRPISQTQARVLDAELNETPPGVPGELYLGGIGLARGYLNRASLTSERFIADPFVAGERLYRTGDLARWRADGQLEYLGRTDHQVKIRGLRIELGEIEGRLASAPAVREAAIIVDQGPGGARLVAYVVGRDIDIDALKSHLSKTLPDYMVPSAILVLETLPLNANGKLDRKALPKPEVSPAGKSESPQGDAERALAKVWARVLGLEAVGRHDNFFELGGDSILSLQIVAGARQAGLSITPRQMFERQSVAALAAVAQVVDQRVTDQETPTGPVPLLPIQAEFFARAMPSRHHWNQAVLLQSHERIDSVALTRALDASVDHHDALRLRFSQDEAGLWTQAYSGFAAQDWLWTRVAADARSLEALCDEAHLSLDLERGPLLRALLVDMPDNTQRLLVTIHHLVVDGVSWRVLLEDLQTAYGQASANSPIALPSRTGSLQAWSQGLCEEIVSRVDELSHWQTLAGAREELPREAVDAGGTRRRDEVAATLDVHATQALLRDAPAAWRTRIDDLLMTALGRALARWTGDDRVLVALEGHGRVGDESTLDLTRTVGWFTTLHPVVIDVAGDAIAALKRVKESLRAVPAGGLGHGLLKWFGDDAQRAAMAALPAPRVVLNYLGQIDGAAHCGGWTLAAEPSGRPMDEHEEAPFELSFGGRVLDGRLSLDLDFDATRHRRATMQGLLDDVLGELRDLVALCTNGSAGLTPSDVPMSGLSQAELDALPVAAHRIADVYPLSPMQAGLLFHSVMDDAAGAYTIQLRVDLSGLEVGRFRLAWQAALQRHDALRTGFWHQRDLPLQWVARFVELPWRELDWSTRTDLDTALDDLARGQHEERFDLAEPPLMRLAVVRTAGDAHRVIWTVHHLLVDGWSTSALLAEVLRHYGGERLPAVVGRYGDHIRWLRAQDAARSEAWWRTHLASLQAPTRLADALPAPATGHRSESVQHRGLDETATQRLVAFARQERVTLNTLVQGAWALLLQRYSGEDVVAFGATVSGRPADLPGAQEMLGLFINTQPVVCAPRADRRVGDWLRALQAESLATREHEHTPLHEIQRWGGQAGQGLFDTLLVFENFPVDEALAGTLPHGLRAGNVRSTSGNHYPFTVRVQLGTTAEAPSARLRLDYLHAPERIDPATALQLAAQFEQLLHALAESASRPLGQVTMDVEQPGAATSSPSHIEPAPSVMALWRRSVSTFADRDALRHEARAWRFGELDAQADALAHRLVACGVGAEVRVGLHADRRAEFVLGLLAVLKAGGVAVPLDPQLPAERLATLLEDSDVGCVLSAETPAWAGSVPVTALGFSGALAADVSSDWPEPHPDQAAYVIYTSGSTGRPKGIAVSHGALAQYVRSLLDRLALPACATSFAMVSTIAADLGHTSLFGALCSGRTLHLVDAQRAFDPDAFAAYMALHQVDVLKIVPSHLQALLQAADPARVLPRHTLVVGGEATSWAVLDRVRSLRPECRVLNHYGPAETTVGVLTQETAVADRAAPTLPVGTSLAHAHVHVLDAWMQSVPNGAVGELYIGGAALSRGYQGQPGQTAQRFVPDPWRSGARLYRTGDRVRRLADGSLVFLGRVDDQVKVRGYRVEPGEVAAALLALPGVREAAVVAGTSDDGRTRLAGYVVAQPGTALDVAELRASLAQRLPDYMVPATLDVLDALPLNANGKIDRRALAVLTSTPVEAGLPASPDDFAAPQGEIEQAIAELWQQALGVARVGRYDNFFELGGDSILTLQIVARGRKRGLKLTARQLMDGQTVAAVAAVAAAVEAAAILTSAAAPTPSSRADEPLALTPMQAWFLAQNFEAPSHWNQSLTLEPATDQPVDVPRLRAAIEQIVGHHEALRLRFSLRDGAWKPAIAEVRAAADGAFEHVELDEDADASAVTACADRAQRSLDIERGPVFRAVLMTRGARSPRLLLVAHHLVVDGVSWRVLAEELRSLLDGAATLAPAPLSYTDCLRAMHALARTPAIQDERAYWHSLVADTAKSLPGAAPNAENTVATSETLTASLDADTTSQLLRVAPAAYRTQINDLLLEALAQALGAWSSCGDVLVELEGHGRNWGDEAIDLSRTVGWFTSVYPVRLRIAADDIAASLKSVKEQLRSVPRSGLGHGLLQLSGEPLAGAGYPQVTFNYLGRIDEGGDADGAWRLASESTGRGRSESSRRRTAFDVTASVRDGCLQVGWTYSRSLHGEATVRALLARFEDRLRELVRHCVEAVASGAGAITPSDVPLAGLAQAELDALPVSSRDIADVYPLSPMQAGMLFHSVLDPTSGAYTNQLRVDLEGLDVPAFHAAWTAVLRRHDVLRTGFWHERARPLQWVAKDLALPWVAHDWQGEPELAMRLAELAQDQHAQGFDLTSPPLMRLAVARTGERRHHVIWTVHHLLVDGWSTSALLAEVLRHYGGERLPDQVARYRDYIGWLGEQDGPGERAALARTGRATRVADAAGRRTHVNHERGTWSSSGGAGRRRSQAPRRLRPRRACHAQHAGAGCLDPAVAAPDGAGQRRLRRDGRRAARRTRGLAADAGHVHQHDPGDWRIRCRRAGRRLVARPPGRQCRVARARAHAVVRDPALGGPWWRDPVRHDRRLRELSRRSSVARDLASWTGRRGGRSPRRDELSGDAHRHARRRTRARLRP